MGSPVAGYDLDYADLKGADLSGARMIGVSLTYADLSYTSLGAILESANLYGANLTGADLSGAILSYANLSNANLIGADLSGSTAARYAEMAGTKYSLNAVDNNGNPIPDTIFPAGMDQAWRDNAGMVAVPEPKTALLLGLGLVGLGARRRV